MPPLPGTLFLDSRREFLLPTLDRAGRPDAPVTARRTNVPNRGLCTKGDAKAAVRPS